MTPPSAALGHAVALLRVALEQQRDGGDLEAVK
jgi:hypothetical protein